MPFDMNIRAEVGKVKYFIPIYGSYYHFLNESALGLCKMLRQECILDSLDCHLWYQGPYISIVQMFSCYPVNIVPMVKPYLTDASSLGFGIKTLQHVRLGREVGFDSLIPLVAFFGERIPAVPAPLGITVIKRGRHRFYAETDELAEKLKVFQMPVNVVQMENESFPSQVNLMRNTRILVAPHGAGTMNQIFMPRGGTVIELFPKGYSDWHAKDVADVFGHRFVEIESDKPGVYGRLPSEEIRRWIDANGWPGRRTVKNWRKQSDDMLRVVRDVSRYSIHPDLVMREVHEALSVKPEQSLVIAGAAESLRVDRKVLKPNRLASEVRPVYETNLWCHRGHLNEDQADYYAQLCREVKPRFVLDIGFCTGRSAAAVLHCASKSLQYLLSIDKDLDYKRPDGRKMAKVLREEFPKFELIEQSSRVLFVGGFLLERFPHGIDFATIDGDHSYCGCAFDLEAVSTHLNESGIMLVDDYNSGPPAGISFPEVTRSVDDFLTSHPEFTGQTWNKDGKGFCIIRRRLHPLCDHNRS